jgi:hypothetical protein
MDAQKVVVGLFEDEARARRVIDAARDLGLSDQQFGVLTSGQRVNASDPASGVLGRAALTEDTTDVAGVLQKIGVPDGEARFYAHEAQAGRTLLVILNADGRAEQVRKLVLDHGGFDVQSQGGEFIRGEGAGVSRGAGPRPVDVTANWEDFRSRYEMLWQQHYGTTDATWAQMEPLYEFAWRLANDTRHRGRPWSEVEGALRRDFEASTFGRGMQWDDAAGPLRDVWEDVAQEALTGAEGGADRRIPTAGTDQSVAARDVVAPPRQGAA